MPARPSGAGRRKLTILLCLRPADGQPGVLNATGMTGPGNHPSQRSGTEVGTERGEETQELMVGSAELALWGTFQAPSSPRLWPPSSTCRADTSPVVPGARWGPCRWVSQIGMFKVAQHPATVLRRELWSPDSRLSRGQCSCLGALLSRTSGGWGTNSRTSEALHGAFPSGLHINRTLSITEVSNG